MLCARFVSLQLINVAVVVVLSVFTCTSCVNSFSHPPPVLSIEPPRHGAATSPRYTYPTVFQTAGLGRKNRNNNKSYGSRWSLKGVWEDLSQEQEEELAPQQLVNKKELSNNSVGGGVVGAFVDKQQQQVPTTFSEALRVFFLAEYNGPRFIVGILIGAIICRQNMVQQPLSAVDAMVAFGAVLFWWFQEHFLHKHLLHSSLDWYGKRIHEEHHLNPYHHISIDPAALMLGWLVTVHALLRMCLPISLAWSATLGYASAGLWYEFLHFMVHTKVRFPHNSYLQGMKTHHARHHLVDSNHWLGFSIPHIDTLFGTNPTLSQARSRK